MTVQSEVSRVNYAGDGSTVAFSTTFYFLANADLRVIIRDAAGTETVQTTGTDYSVTGAGNANGGTVTFVSAPASGETVVIIRDPPLTQLTDYNDQDPFPADSHERALDKLTMLIGRLAEKFARSVLLQETSTLTGLVFPNPEAGKFFRWNGDADGIENATFADATEAFPTTAGRYIRRNDDGDAYAALSATQSANLDAIRDMGIGSQVELTDAANAITSAHAGKTLLANRGSAISFDFEAAADLGTRFWVEIKNVGAGQLTINPDGAETIDGNASKTVEQYESLKVYSDGTELISAFYVPPVDLSAVDQNIIPDTDGSRNIGSAAKRFAQGHFDFLHFADNAGIKDSNGNEALLFGETASAVNHPRLNNAATGNAPSLEALGDDTNIDLLLTPKGTGKLALPWYKLPNADGTDQQALITNGAGVLSWGAAGGWKWLATKTASASAQLDFTEFNNSIYRSYEFEFENILPASDAEFEMRFSSTAGVSFSSSSYKWISHSQRNATVDAHNASYSAAIRISGNTDVESSGDTRGLNGRLRLQGAGNSGSYTFIEFKTGFIDPLSNHVMANGEGWREANSITDAVRFFFDSVNITSGSITMYGLRSS